MNALVYAHLVQLHADAALKLERLRSRHRATPNLGVTSSARLRIFREITELESQVKSWHYVMEAAMLAAEEDDVDGVPE